jgi:hypothetical protein
MRIVGGSFMRNQPVKSLLCAVLPWIFLISSGGCTTAPISETQQLLLDLDRSYTIGAISKQDYERRRAELQERRRREIVQSGSTVNESMRGILNEGSRNVILSPP